jgi:hypothetical protein
MKTQYIKINEYGDKYYYADKAMTIRHREDGPALEYADGDKAWYVDGKCFITEEEFNRRTAKEIVLTMDEIAAKFGIDVKNLKITK